MAPLSAYETARIQSAIEGYISALDKAEFRCACGAISKAMSLFAGPMAKPT